VPARAEVHGVEGDGVLDVRTLWFLKSTQGLSETTQPFVVDVHEPGALGDERATGAHFLRRPHFYCYRPNSALMAP